MSRLLLDAYELDLVDAQQVNENSEKELNKNNARTPDNWFYLESSSHYYEVDIDNIDMQDLRYKVQSIKLLKTIKNCVLFFTILTITSITLSLLLYMQ